MCRRLLGGWKAGGPHPIINMDMHSIGLCGGIHLSKKLHTHLGEGPWTRQVWIKKQDNGPKGNKDPEGLSYISDLHPSVLWSSSLRTPTLLSRCVALPSVWLPKRLLIREDVRTLSLWVCISVLLLSWINCFPVCSFIHCAVSLMINAVPAFSVCLLETFLLSNSGKSQGHFASSLWSLVV